jgi:hypothetical protein
MAFSILESAEFSELYISEPVNRFISDDFVKRAGIKD